MKEQKKRDSLSSALAIGALSGATETIITNPLVTIKSCLQRGVPLPWHNWFPHNAKLYILPSGVANMTRFMYRGLGARMTIVGLSVGMRMAVHDCMVNYVFEPTKITMQQEFVIPICAGFLSGIYSAPLELGMTLQQTNTNKQANSLIKTLQGVQRKWGFRKSFTGFSCIFLRDAAVTSGFLNFTPAFKDYAVREYDYDNNASSLIGGTVIGAGLSVLTHPLDTIKTIQQTNLRDSTQNNASSIMRTAAQIFAKDGMRGFNKGIYFRATRIGLHVGIVSSMTDALTDFSNQYLRNNKI